MLILDLWGIDPVRQAVTAVLAIAFFVVTASLASAQERPRYALVIGNARYSRLPSADQLRNPTNDARDMARELGQLGFKVDLMTNAGLGSMEKAVSRFGEELSSSQNSVGFFYYAGHGVQLDGRNYLIPSDAYVVGPGFLDSSTLQLQSVLDTLQQAANHLNIVVLDACRNNPFKWSRSISGNRGLAVVQSQPQGSIIAYAAAAGRTAEDGAGSNGVYTGELLKYLAKPGLDVLNLFKDVGQAVYTKTNGFQNPAIYSQYNGNFYLVAAPKTATAAKLDLQRQELTVQLTRLQQIRSKRATVGGILGGIGVVGGGLAALFYFFAANELSSVRSSTTASNATVHLLRLETDGGLSLGSAVVGAGTLLAGLGFLVSLPPTGRIKSKIQLLNAEINAAAAQNTLER